VILLGLFLLPAIGADNPAVRSGSDEGADAAKQSEPKLEKIQRTTAEWRKRLTRKQFSVMPSARHGASFQRQVLGSQRRRHLLLRGL